jgi:hypothetical protein
MLLQAGDATNYIWTAAQNSTNWAGSRSLNIYTAQTGANIGFFTEGDAIKTKLMILGDGDVGIGTNSPDAKLDILGKALNLGANNGSWTARTSGVVKTGFITSPHYVNAEEDIMGMIMIGNTTENEISIGGGTSSYNAATKISFFTATNSSTVTGTQTMLIYGNGNVGIGTGSAIPKARLEVAASVNGNPVTSGSTQTNAALRVRGNATNVLDIGQQSASPFAMWMQVCESTSLGVSYPLVINPNGGNVGIGTDSPSSKLTVSSATKGLTLNEANIEINSSTDAFAVGIGGSLGFASKLTPSSNANFIMAKIGGYRENATTGSLSGFLSFETRSVTSSVAERMRIDSSGNVSIISGKLSIGQSSENNIAYTTGETWIGSNGLRYNSGSDTFARSSATAQAAMMVLTTTADVEFYAQPSTSQTGTYALTPKMVIKGASGNVDVASDGGVNKSAILMQNSHFVNKRFSFDPLVSNAPIAYMILCEYAPNQDVNGIITMDRTSGLRHACSIQVLISSGSGTSPVAGLKAMGVAGASTPFYELVTCDYDDGTGSSSHIAVKMSNPDGYYETSGAYFTGRIVNSNSGVIVPVLPTAVSNVVIFEANCKHNFQGDLTVNQGNVGIGTNSPGRELEVVGVIKADGTFISTASSSSTNLATGNGGQLSLFNSNSTDGNFSNIGGYNSNSLVTSQICFINESHTSRTGEIAFLTHNGSSMPERMRIDQSGNILIGTTGIENPRSLALALEIEAGSPVGIILNDSRDTHPMGIENAGAVMNFTYNTSPLMTILASGNVGIGETSPNTKLDVSGTTGTRNRNTQGSSVYETSLYFGAAGNATTNVSIDTTTAFPPMASGGFILVEVSASGYGSGGTNGLIFSYISGGYGGHYGGQNQPYHPVEIIANTMQAGSCTFYYPNSTTVGIAVTTTNSGGLNGVMRVKVTTTY